MNGVSGKICCRCWFSSVDGDNPMFCVAVVVAVWMATILCSVWLLLLQCGWRQSYVLCGCCCCSVDGDNPMFCVVVVVAVWMATILCSVWLLLLLQCGW